MFPYKKIAVIGCPGSGKTTFSKKLAAITALPLYHLDLIYWKSDATHLQRPEFKQKQEEIVSNDEWIIDGNFKRTLEIRIKNAELIYFLDLPVDDCIYGVITREREKEFPCFLPVNDELIEDVKKYNSVCKPIVLSLFEKYPDKTEGELTKLRASIVCEPTLALCSRQIKLGEWILLSKGEEHTGGRNRDSITSDAMEAVIGAIYRDGGFEPAQDYIRRFILEDIDNKKLFYDSKTILQELLQKDSGFEPEYEITGESGPDHDKHFTAVVKCDGTVIGDGEGHTKKAAQQAAAYNAILKMRQNRK